MKLILLLNVINSKIGICPDLKSDSCKIGGMGLRCMGKKCPKCWIKHNENTWACYEPINNQCEWKGMFNIDKLSNPCKAEDATKDNLKPIIEDELCPDITTDTCYRGGIISEPCKGLHCPTCWIPSPDKRNWYCFERLNNECLFFPNLIDVLQNTDKCPELCEE